MITIQIFFFKADDKTADLNLFTNSVFDSAELPPRVARWSIWDMGRQAFSLKGWMMFALTA